jgi:hypothetical protein
MPKSTQPEAGPVIRIVPQRNDSDCAIATLAMLSGLPYEDVLIAAARTAECETGMYLTQIQKVASELGIELVAKKSGRYDIESDTGILRVSDRKAKNYHVVVLRRGLVIETDGSLWDADVYLASKRYKAGSLLVEA